MTEVLPPAVQERHRPAATPDPQLRTWLDATCEFVRAVNRGLPGHDLLDLIAGTVAQLTAYDFCAVFGGFGDSGYGREHAVESLLEFTRTKSIREPSGIGDIPYWSALDDIADG